MIDDQIPDNMKVMVQEPTAPVEESLGPDTAPEDVYITLIKYCLDMYKLFEGSEYRKSKIKDIKESREVYEQVADPAMEIWPGASNEVLPLTAITIDNLEPRLTAGLIGRDPILLFDIIGANDKDDMTKFIESYFNYQLKQNVRIETKTMDIVHTLLLDGTYFCEPQYSTVTKNQIDFVYDQNGQLIIDPNTKRPVTQEVQQTIYEGGDIVSIPFTDILCADNIGTIAEWEKADKIRRIYPTYAELMRNKNDIGYLPDNIGPWLYGQQTDEKKTVDSKAPADLVSGVGVTGKKVIECAVFYISYPINVGLDMEWKDQKDFIEEEIVATIALDSKKLIRLMYKKDLLFSNASLIKRIRLYPEESRSFGSTTYSKVKGMQNGASNVFNSIINSFFVLILGGGFYEDGAGLSGAISKSPGEYIQVDDVKKILNTTPNINPAAYIGLFEVIVQLWERAGGISNPQMGRPDSKEKTATEIMMVIQEGNSKFDYQARNTRDEFISILVTMYDLYYQYMPYNATFNYQGKDIPIRRNMMRRDYKYSLSGSTAAANKMIERKEAEDIYNLGMANPLVNPMQVLEELLTAYGKHDPKRYIKPEIQQLLGAFMQDPQGIGGAIKNYIDIRTRTEQEIDPGKRPKVGPKAAKEAVANRQGAF